jgi:transcriptional regulator with XRE-family HTH domain
MASEFDKRIGRRVAMLREQVGLSQEDVAARLGVKRVTVSQMETGERKITAQEAMKLSQIFNTKTDVLLDPRKDIVVTLEKGHKSTSGGKPKLRISVPQKNVAKFKEILLYILKQVGSKPNIGESVLYKLLYFIDFDHYEKYEEQLIGATYIKNHYGPTPKEFVQLVEEMKDKDLIIVKTKYYKFPQTKYLPRREPDLSKLSAQELETIDTVLKRLSDMNAKEISAHSHDDVPWLTTEDGEIIDYESVFYRNAAYSVRSYDDEDIQ